MKYPDWYKQFREVEMVALKRVKPAVRAVYHYLRASSPGFNCEPVEGITYKVLKDELRIGETTIKECIKELEKRKLLETFKPARKDGIKFQFIFNYVGSSIQIIRGQVVIVTPDQEFTEPNEECNTPKEEQLPYIEGEEKYIYDALRKQVSAQLQDLHIYPRMFESIIESPFGVRFAQEILANYPEAKGSVIRIKLQDKKNVNQFKVIDMFRREGSKLASGSLLVDCKTNEVGEWEWCGKMGKVHLPNETVIVNSLEGFRKWVAA